LVSFAQTLKQIFPLVPGGILIFLPSYSVMKTLQKVWKKERVFKSFDREVYIEPPDQAKSKSAFQEYLKAIQKTGKAAFIAVCRGKLSEGIDFSDAAARTVIMAGIPYP